MNKIHVEVYVSAAGKTYEVLLPPDCRMCDIIQILSSCFEDLASGFFKASEDTVICNEEGHILDINKTVSELSVLNGARLILI